MQNRFSLVITNYNRAQFLDRAIRSCTGQLLFRTPFEIIVVDDASTDSSLDIIKEFKTDIRSFVHSENLGVAAASNKAITEATGTYWMRVDADDFLNHYACALMGMVLDENPDIDFVYCDHYRVDIRGVKVSKVKLDTEEQLLEHGAGVLFRTEKLREIGGYDESLKNCEDYDLLLRLKKNRAKGYYLPVPLYRYYIHGENMTLTPDRQEYKDLVKRKHEPKN
jgi:glycosyltransferase involved in cell wall biosynthesis